MSGVDKLTGPVEERTLCPQMRRTQCGREDVHVVDGAENGADENVQLDVVERKANDMKQGVVQRGCPRVREGFLCGEVLQKVHREMCCYRMECVDGVARGAEPSVSRCVREGDAIGFEVRRECNYERVKMNSYGTRSLYIDRVLHKHKADHYRLN